MLCSKLVDKLKMQYFIIDQINDENDAESSSHSAANVVEFSPI